MSDNPLTVRLAQPTLFDLGEASSGVVELFPAVWMAAEAFTSPDLNARRTGLERLVELNAPRLSPLITYLLATRLVEPDLELRSAIVSALAGIFGPDRNGQPAPEAVRAHVTAYLSQARTRPIFALLQVSVYDPGLEQPVAILLNACSFAGHHLSAILVDRSMPLLIRQQAAHFIGLVGFLDGMAALERLEARLESRVNGQQAMPFAPVGEQDEAILLPVVKKSLALLRET